MSNWKYKLRFKHILSDEVPTEEQLKEICNEASSAITRFTSKLNRDDENEETMYYELKDCAYEFENETNSLTEFNNTLNLMYDLCDQYRIWVN